MKLGQYLETQNIRRSDFADRLGISQSFLSRVIRGERSPGIPLAVLIEELTEGAVAPVDFVGLSREGGLVETSVRTGA